MLRNLIRIPIICVSCLLLVMATMLMQPAILSFAKGASISLSLTYGPPTSSVQVSGLGFKGGESIALTFDTTQVGTATGGNTGSFSSTIIVPAAALPGNHFVQARGTGSGFFAQTTFLVETNWVQSGFNRAHTGFNVFENVLNPTNVSGLMLDWQYNVGGDIFAFPVVVDGVVYVGCSYYPDNVCALNASTGARIWSYPIFGASTPAVADGIVYFSSADHKLYALNTATGAPQWSYSSIEPESSPLVANGIVYIGSSFGRIHAIDGITGKPLWSYNTGNREPISSPVTTNGVVYFGSEDGNLYALNASKGTFHWKYSTGSSSVSPLAVSNGVVYFGSIDHILYALNASTGALLWSYTTGNSIHSSPAVANGVVYISSYDHYLYAFHLPGTSP
jgi:outer membrane protein assembly factor BamB